MDEVLLKLVSRGCTEEALEALAISRNRFVSMWEDGARKVLSGQTTLEELQLVAVKREVSLSPSELKG
jgi:type II secretory ATPase GspE/PulE/Tfp pilus assembly ATPase PilB-like protein